MNIEQLSQEIINNPSQAELYYKRGQAYYGAGNMGAAINDLNRAMDLKPDFAGAQELKDLIEEILAFRYVDIYNP